MTQHPPRRPAIHPRWRRAPIAAAIALTCSSPTWAFEIDTGIPDVAVRWDQTLKFNLMARTSGIASDIGNNGTYDESDYRFPNQWDITSLRTDLYSEFDATYRRNHGLRLSAAAWYDPKYNNTNVPTNPALYSSANFTASNHELTSYTKRFYNGPSGEILDGFLWGNFRLGSSELALKAGRHVQLWGEAVFPTASGNSVAFAQAPSDGLKQSISPGATAKETAMPTHQVTGTWQVTDRTALVGLYTLEWRPSRASEGGTFFGVDSIQQGSPSISGAGLLREELLAGRKGAWGLGARWRPGAAWLDAGNTLLGAFYREFDDQTNTWSSNTYLVGAAPRGRAVYARNIQLLGVTANASLGGTAVGFEVSQRRNAPLTSQGLTSATLGYEGARGNTWHALANTTTVFGPNPLWDTASLVLEVTYQRLGRVTRNANLYKSVDSQPGTCSIDETAKGCATRDASHFALNFSPTWQQVWPSTDLSASITYQRGIKGNAPTGGINEGFQVVVAGLTADYQGRHRVSATYTNYAGMRSSFGASTAAGPISSPNGGAYLADRDNVALTYIYNF